MQHRRRRAVSYVVQESDAGSVINNNAVVTVRTQEATPREFQETATSAVAVPLPEAAPLDPARQRQLCHGWKRRVQTITISANAVDQRGHDQHSPGGYEDIIRPFHGYTGRNWNATTQESGEPDAAAVTTAAGRHSGV